MKTLYDKNHVTIVFTDIESLNITESVTDSSITLLECDFDGLLQAITQAKQMIADNNLKREHMKNGRLEF